MDLQKLIWPEVKTYLETSKTIIIPIGSCEQHGPTGLMGTDSISAQAIALELGSRNNTLVAPTISVGMAAHHMAFSGTITLQPETLVLVICDYVNSLSEHGFDDFIFINGHGGNVASLKAAFEKLDQNCRYYNWYMGDATQVLRKELYGDQEGSHATPSEIALVHYIEPMHIHQADLEPVCAPSKKYKGPDEMRKMHPDGRIGSNVSLANPEQGQQLFEAALKDLTPLFSKDR